MAPSRVTAAAVLNGARILAATGTTASVLSLLGGYLTPWFPRLGPVLVGSAGAVMLAGNVVCLIGGT